MYVMNNAAFVRWLVGELGAEQDGWCVGLAQGSALGFAQTGYGAVLDG